MSVSIETKEELFAVMEQIAGEREAARPIVEKLVASGEPIDDIEIPERWRTAGFVMELSAAAGHLRAANPARSLSLQQVAFVIAKSLDGNYPSLIRARFAGSIWVEIGIVHCFQNAYEAAFRAYDAAHACFASEAALHHDDGRVMINRSGALSFSRRYDDALRVVTEACELFSSFGDERRLAMTEFLKGLIFHMRGELIRARSRYEEALTKLKDIDDLETLARLYGNLGCVCGDLGDSLNAAVHLQQARALHQHLGNSLLVDKVDWALARSFLVCGDFAKALPMLHRVREVFLSQRMPEDAGEVALDIVEALVATNRVGEAKALTEQVIVEFRSANLNEQAIIAVGYLRVLLSTTQQARQAVRHVRAYVEKLKTEPALLFLPLEN